MIFGAVVSTQRAQPFADALAHALGEPVQVMTEPDYDSLWRALGERRVQLAWLPPLVYARAQDESVRLVAVPERGGAVGYRAAIVVQRACAARSLRELRLPRAAWVDRVSASGYLFPRLALVAAGVRFASERFLGSYLEAARAVARGEADVAACHVSARAALDPARLQAAMRGALDDLAADLRVLHLTDDIPPDALVVRSDQGEALERALFGLHRTVQGTRAIAELFQADRLLPANEALERLRRENT